MSGLFEVVSDKFLDCRLVLHHQHCRGHAFSPREILRRCKHMKALLPCRDNPVISVTGLSFFPCTRGVGYHPCSPPVPGRAAGTMSTPQPTEITLHQASRILEIAFSDGAGFRLSCEFL